MKPGKTNEIKLENNSTVIPNKTKSNFDINNNTWVPDKAKRSYHQQRLGQSKWAFRLSFWGAIAGFIIIVWCIDKSVNKGLTEWIGIVSGVTIEAVSALFFHLSNKANEKISEFFKELTDDANVKEAIKLVEDIKDDKIRDELLVKLSLHLSGVKEERICKNVRDICKIKDDN